MITVKKRINILPWYNPYVTHGLVGMWDGEWNAGPGRHDAGATGLADLSGSVRFEGADDCIATDKAFCISAEHYMAFLPTTLLSILGGGNSYTVELFHTPRGEGGSTLLFTRPDSYNMIISSYWGERESYQIRNCAVYNDPTRTDDRGFHGAIVHAHPQDRIFLDGRLMLTGDAAAEPIPTRVYFFRDFIHCLRIYDRALSDDEIAANYAIDRERFL